MQPCIKGGPGPNEHVHGHSKPPENLVGKAALSPVGRGVIGHDQENIVVAVRTGLAPGLRPEEVDSLGLIGNP